MDTQIKLFLRKYKFGTSYYDDTLILDTNVNDTLKLGERLFSFKEYDKVDLLFFSNNKEVRIKVESFISETPITMTSGEILSLSPGGDSDDMLVPGSYEISVLYNNIEIKGLYLIEPNSINYDSLLKMRETIDSICKGLSLNLYYERSGLEYIPNNMSGIDILAFSYLETNHKDLLSSMTSILNNPLEDVTKDYSLVENSKRPDNKSIRWQNKHSNANNSRTPYKEKTIVVATDNQENRLIKLISERLFFSISRIEDKIFSHIEFLEDRCEDVISKINNLEAEKNKLQGLYNVKRRIGEVKRDIGILNIDVESYKTKINKLKLSLRNVTECKNNIATFLNKDWVRNIRSARKIKPTQKFLKRVDYSFLYKVYLEILEKSNLNTPSKTFPSKKTSLLYEVYAVIMVKNILEDIGFKWVDGWIRGVSDSLTFNGELGSGEEIILKKGEYKIEISYDKLLRRTSELKKTSESGIVASNSDRRKPDILISLYKNDRFIKSMVVEVKYRKAAYLYNNNGETDVIHQLKEYRNLDYFDGTTRRVSDIRPIQKVIVVHPGDKETKFIEDIYGFSFLSLLPNGDLNPIGYSLLKDEIEEFIISYLEWCKKAFMQLLA